MFFIFVHKNAVFNVFYFGVNVFYIYGLAYGLKANSSHLNQLNLIALSKTLGDISFPPGDHPLSSYLREAL